MTSRDPCRWTNQQNEGTTRTSEKVSRQVRSDVAWYIVELATAFMCDSSTTNEVVVKLLEISNFGEFAIWYEAL